LQSDQAKGVQKLHLLITVISWLGVIGRIE
jgi:hypothetical protein